MACERIQKKRVRTLLFSQKVLQGGVATGKRKVYVELIQFIFEVVKLMKFSH